MYTVGRLGSYITRGVYTVSGPFHPFGGAVDIIVVEQPDGSFKSSPWYVRFGKFQGVLRAREKVVNINVNGVDVDLHMYLDERGQAYFLREIEGEDEESVSSSSGDETDEQYQESGTMKSKSCNYDSSKFSSDDHIDRRSGEIVASSNSQRSKIFGLVFGQRSLEKDDCQDEAEGSVSSLERAEVAANLLDEHCSADSKTSSPRKIGGSNFSAWVTSNCKEDKDKLTNEGQSRMDSSAKDVSETSVDQCLLADETCSNSLEMNGFLSGSENQELFMDQTNVEISSSGITERTVHSFKMDESASEETETSVISRSVDEHNVKHTCEHADDEGAVYDATFPDENSNDGWVSNERNDGLTGFSISGEGGPNKIRSFLYCEKTESSVLGFDETKDQSKETLHLTSGGSEEVHFCSEALHVPTELLHEDRVTQEAENIELNSLNFDSFNTSPEQKDPSSIPTFDHDDRNFEISLTVPESHTEMATMDPILSIVDVGSNSMTTIFDSSNSKLQIQNDINIGDDISSNDFPSSIKSNGDLELFNGDGELTKTVTFQTSESAEEQFLFSDVDEMERTEANDDSNFPISNKEECASSCLVGSNEVNWPADTNDECASSGEINIGSLKVASSPIFIPKPSRAGNAEVRRLGESLPNILSCANRLSPNDIKHPLSRSLGSNSKSLDWNLHYKDEPHFINSDMEKENQSPLKNSNKDNSDPSKDVTNAVVNPAVENQSGGSWKFWPFSFRRSRSRKATQPTLVKSKSSDAVNVSDGNIVADDDKTVNLKASKKMVRANTPTSEELASLNLKDGSNVVTFTFSTAMLGKQKVDARIYLWHWNTRIVISDVDGTITRSDVLGQFMPLVGVDWSQTGVAHLFSAIKENGYQLLFLSARAISQAYITRQFLVNLKQDGKALPDGPVVISPDGLFPSLFREVIRRAPHEFKIACLEDIKALFPPDCNPFYAGFGNRDTDEISYLKVGIPKGKIFIINPRGEVAVNRRVDTKSYTSLHDHVHGMFPVMTSSEQEDYNSWNFWRLPPPDIDL